MSGGRPPNWKRGNSAGDHWGLDGDDEDFGKRTGDWTETMGDLEGGTGDWNGTKGNFWRRTGEWNETMGEFEGRNEAIWNSEGKMRRWGIWRVELGIGMGNIRTW